MRRSNLEGPKSFTFKMDESSGVPLWVQLRNRVVYLINSGYYNPNDQLPTIHTVASELSINYNTVSKVYTSLADDGYITAKRGVGAFVNGFNIEESAERANAVDEILSECIAGCTDLGMSLKDIEKAMRNHIRKIEHEQGIESANRQKR